MLTRKIASSLMVALMAIAVAHQAKPSEYPRWGILHGDIDGDILIYDCDPPQRGEMECEFDQIFIRRSGDQEKFQEELSKLPELFSELDDGELSELCDKFENAVSGKSFSELLESSLKAKSASEIEKEDMRRIMSALIGFCREKNVKTFEEMIKAQQNLKARTCKVMLFEYKQTFTRTTQSLFVQKSRASGPCGVVGVSRFVKDGDYFWNYIGEDKITNPDGESVLGMSCKELQEQPSPYTWNTRPMYKGCDYIKGGL